MLVKLLQVLVVVVLLYLSAVATSEIERIRFYCIVCNNLIGHLQALKPVTEYEIVKINNGWAFVQTVTDSTQVERFHAVSRAVTKSINKSFVLTKKGYKNSLCIDCQKMHELIKNGARISRGQTKNGDITVVTSTNTSTMKRDVFFLPGFVLWPWNPKYDNSPPVRRRKVVIIEMEPRVAKIVKAKYPKEALDNKIEGRVYLWVLVGIDGKVKDYKVEENSDEIFKKAAVEAVKQWEFKPAIRNKKKVEEGYLAEFRFIPGEWITVEP